MFYNRYEFFDRQIKDDAGFWSVRLQQTILVMFLVSFFSFIMNLVYGVLVGNYHWGFYFGWLGWLVLFAGFYGAYKRVTGLILIYMIMMSIFTVLQAMVLIWAISEGAVTHHKWCKDHNCYEYHLGDIVTYWLYVLFSFIWWFIELYSIRIAVHLRRALNFLDREYISSSSKENPHFSTVYATGAGYQPHHSTYGTWGTQHSSVISTPPPSPIQNKTEVQTNYQSSYDWRKLGRY